MNSHIEVPFSFEVKDGAIGLMEGAEFLDAYKNKDHDVFYVKWFLAINTKDVKLWINGIEVKLLRSLSVSWTADKIIVAGTQFKVMTTEDKLNSQLEAFKLREESLRTKLAELQLELVQERLKNHLVQSQKNNPYTYPNPFTQNPPFNPLTPKFGLPTDFKITCKD